MHAKEKVPIFCQPAACVADGQETGVMTTRNNCLALRMQCLAYTANDNSMHFES